MHYAIPAGSTGSVAHTVNYTSSLSAFSWPVLPTQIASTPANLRGFGTHTMTAPGGGPYVGTFGEVIRITGSVVLLADDLDGPVGMHVVPVPGAGTACVGLGGLLAARRRRR